MITAKQNNDYLPGTWKGLQTKRGRKASFTDPKGHTLSLASYTIGKDGRVHPSVLCSRLGCGFHEFVKLEGWDPSVNE